MLEALTRKGLKDNKGIVNVFIKSADSVEESLKTNPELMGLFHKIRKFERNFLVMEDKVNLTNFDTEVDNLIKMISEKIPEYKPITDQLRSYKTNFNTAVQLNKQIKKILKKFKDHGGKMRDGADKGNQEIEKYIKRFVAHTQLVLLIAAIIFAVILFVSGFAMKRFIIKPINDTTSMLKDISEGEGDLTKRLKVKTDDEISQMVKYFNQFLVNLNQMMGNIKEVSQKANLVSNDLSATSEESSAALSQMNANIQDLTGKIQLLDKEVGQSYQSANEVKDFITHVVNQISSQATAIEESSASTEEMLASIKNIAKVSESKLEIANKLEGTAHDGEAEMKNTMAMIHEVANSANVIMEMIDVINNIAEQTNLLAMNAAIEAAHAGDAGKGFAVVADEIRKLAETSGRNANEISKSLKEVINYIKISEESTSKTEDLFLNIVQGTKDVANSMLEMKAATEELSLGSEQIMKALGSLITISEDVKSSSGEMDTKISKISQSMQNLSSISNQSNSEMQEVAHGISELFKAVDHVSENGVKNSENVTELKRLISQFKIDESAGDITIIN